MNLDEILTNDVGQFGRYQKVTVAFLTLIVIFFTFASDEYDYTTAKIPHRCRIAECEGLPSDVPHPEFRPEWLLNAINGQSLDSFESCTRFAYSASLHSSNDSCPAEWFDRKSEVNCDEYVYENTNGVVYDFGLACNDKKREILESYTTLAILQFVIMIGGLGDKKGRRSVLIITLFIAGCLGFIRSFIASYIWFLILRLLQIGIGCNTVGFCFILGIELAGPNYRVIVGAILLTMVPLGQIILSLMAWTVTSWRTLLLIIFTPQLLIISYFWIIPESVRWLICKEQYTKADTVLRKMAASNKKQLSNKTIDDLKALSVTTNNTNEKKQFIVRVILKTPGIVPRIFIFLLWYVINSLMHYSMEEITVNIVEQPHLNYLYITTFSISGIWTSAFLLDHIGRKRVIVGGYLLCTACQLALAFIPGSSVLFTIVYLLGKYVLAVVTSSVNIYSLELFPTEHRSIIFAYFYLHTILGHKLEPYVAYLGTKLWIGLPSVLISCLAVISAVLVKFTPETRGIKLPDTMEEAGRIGKEQTIPNI